MGVYFLWFSSKFKNNKLSNLILDCDVKFIDRLNLFYDNIFIDEFQVFSSDEIDIVYKLREFNGNVFLFGVFYQTTYATSNRGSKNKNL